MVVIDGSHGEGGGQVLRTSLALAAVTGRPVRIEHIRAGRSKPGLRPQHLTAARAAAAICDARLEGDELGSQSLVFVPGGPPRPGEYVFDVAQAAKTGSAGSVGLVLQTVLIPLALVTGESRLTLRGGTHVPSAPSASYLEHVFLPAIARMGVSVQVDVVRWGFYPTGGGEMRVRIVGRNESLRPIVLTERGELQRVWGMAAAMNLPAHIPQRMTVRVRNVLEGEAVKPVQVAPRRLRGAGPGAGIFLFAEYARAIAGFTAYGRKGLPSERVAENACKDILAHHRAGVPLDPYLADQLVVPMAVAQGASHVTTSRVSPHLLTNVWTVRQFLAVEINVEGEPGMQGTLVLSGRGT